MTATRPLTYDAGQHRPFADGETVPADTVPRNGFAAAFATCAGRPQAPGNAIPLCTEMTAAIEAALWQALARLIAGTGIAITVRPDGSLLLTNRCCEQTNVEI
jgi:hypothetical protein